MSTRGNWLNELYGHAMDHHIDIKDGVEWFIVH